MEENLALRLNFFEEMEEVERALLLRMDDCIWAYLNELS